MSYKAEAGIRSSFTELTEARKIFDIGWDANMFYPNWKENKDIIPTILGAGVLGNEVVSEELLKLKMEQILENELIIGFHRGRINLKIILFIQNTWINRKSLF